MSAWGGIETAGDANDHLVDIGALQAFCESLYLNVVCLIAAAVALARIRGHEGKTVVGAIGHDAIGRGRGEGHINMAEGREFMPVVLHALAKGVHA